MTPIHNHRPAHEAPRLAALPCAACLIAFVVMLLCVAPARAQTDTDTDPAADAAARQADLAARRMLERAGDLLLAGESDRGIKMLQTLTQQHPDSPVRFEAYLAMGKHMIDTADYPRAVLYLTRVQEIKKPETPLTGDDLETYLEALHLTGVAHYESGRFAAAFPVLRRITTEHPDTDWANRAYHTIGMSHFKQGHWHKAIEALSLVGTSISPDAPGVRFVEAGRRFYIKIEDGDLPVLDQLGREVGVSLTTAAGDRETLTAAPLAGDAALFIASIPTAIADPTPGDDTLQVRGGDTITVTYLDDNTRDGEKDVPRTAEVRVVSTAALSLTRQTFDAPAAAAFIEQPLTVLLEDADLDAGPDADTATVRIVSRYRESSETDDPDGPRDDTPPRDPLTESALNARFGMEEDDAAARWRVRDQVELTLTELRKADAGWVRADAGSAGNQGPIHSGRFGGVVQIAAHTEGQAIDRNDESLAAAAGDQIRAIFIDELHIAGDSPREATATLTVAGRLDTSVVARQNIVTDAVLRSRKHLVEATAYLELARIFKSMGLSDGAAEKAEQGLNRVNPVITEESPIPGELREEAMRLKWELLITQEKYDQAIATCRAFHAMFPDSPFVDQALMGIATIRTKEHDYAGAIAVYRQVLALDGSQARAEAQFRIAEALEERARRAAAERGEGETFAISDAEDAVQAYQQCAERYPDSPFAGPALGKLVDFHLATRDFVAADDLLDQVFTDHPDADFLDVMLLKWVLAAYRMGDYEKALDKCNQLIFAYPGSTHAAQARELLPRIEAVAARANQAPDEPQPTSP